jgi:signal transduction histidine kinase
MRAYIFLCICFLSLIQTSCRDKKPIKKCQAEMLLDSASNLKYSTKQRLVFNKNAFDRLIEDNENDSVTLRQLTEVANLFFKLKKYNSFKEVVCKTKNLAIAINDSNSIAKCHQYLGSYYAKKNISDSSYYNYLKAIKAYKQIQNDYGLMTSYYKLAVLQSDMYDNWEAQLSVINAYMYAKKLDDIDMQRNSLIMLAMMLNDLGDYSQAIEKNLEALKIIEKFGDTLLNKETCTNNLGAVYQNSGNHKRAIWYFQQVLKNKKVKHDYPQLYATVLSNIAYSKIRQKKLKDVDSKLLEALEVRLNEGDTNEVIASYNNLVGYYLAISDTTLAKDYSKKALALSQSEGNAKSMLISLLQASKADVKMAPYYFKFYVKLQDSLQIAERRNRNKFARIAFETDQIIVEKDRAIKQKWIVSAVASTLLLLVTLLFIIRLQRARQKELILIHQQQKTDESIYQLINDQQLKVDEGRQAEKKRIARELHDGIMNRLASTRLNLFILNKAQDSGTINKCLSFINNIQDIEKEIRQVAHDLNHEIFSENKGFDLLLETLFETYRNINNIKLFTEVDPTFNWEMTESALRMNIYRILQEALQNSYNYAQAKNIFVTLTREENSARIIVHDDGKGFNPKKVKRGMGLKSISARAAELHGEFKIISAENEGTIIDVLLPLSRV